MAPYARMSVCTAMPDDQKATERAHLPRISLLADDVRFINHCIVDIIAGHPDADQGPVSPDVGANPAPLSRPVYGYDKRSTVNGTYIVE